MATAEFSKFAGILSAALLGFGIAQLKFHHLLLLLRCVLVSIIFVCVCDLIACFSNYSIILHFPDVLHIVYPFTY